MTRTNNKLLRIPPVSRIIGVWRFCTTIAMTTNVELTHPAVRTLRAIPQASPHSTNLTGTSSHLVLFWFDIKPLGQLEHWELPKDSLTVSRSHGTHSQKH